MKLALNTKQQTNTKFCEMKITFCYYRLYFSKPVWKDGSTAILVLVLNEILYIANIGDSQVSLQLGAHSLTILKNIHSLLLIGAPCWSVVRCVTPNLEATFSCVEPHWILRVFCKSVLQQDTSGPQPG